MSEKRQLLSAQVEDVDIDPKDDVNERSNSNAELRNFDDDDVDLVSCLLAELLGAFAIILLALGAVYCGAVVTFDLVTTDRLLYMAVAYGMV